MRTIIIFLFTGTLMLCTIAGASPAIPAEYYGQVTINGNPAPAGTVITAVIDNVASGSITTTIVGEYGGTGAFDKRLTIAGTSDGQEVTFTINGRPADQAGTYHSGLTQQLTLSTTGSAAVTATTATTTTTTATTTTTTIAGTVSTATTTSATAAETTVASTTSKTMSPTAVATVKTTGTGSIPAGDGQAAGTPLPIQQKTMMQEQPTTTAAAAVPPSAATRSPGFSFETLGLLLVVMIGGLVLRK